MAAHLSLREIRWLNYSLAITGILLWIGYWYIETIQSMVIIWSRSPTFAHGYLVAPISLWLIWKNRRDLISCVPNVKGRFLIFVLVCGLVWLVGQLLKSNSITQFALIGLIVSSITAVLGTEATRSIAFPLGFLFFSVPFGEFLLPYLMSATADFTVIALRFTGIPVHREGLNFVIPSGNWSVVEACSGIRYLIASVTIGMLFAYLNYKSLYRRLLFVGISILVPVIANWLRAYFIVLLGHFSDNRLAAGIDHIVYGWVFFGIVMMIMFLIGSKWSEKDTSVCSSFVVSPAPSGNLFALSGTRLPLVSLSVAILSAFPHIFLDNLEKNVRLDRLSGFHAKWLAN